MAETELQGARDRLASTQKAAEIAAANLSSSKSKIDQAQAWLVQSQAGRRQLAVRGAEASASTANIDSARANLAAAELLLSYTTITAPFDGVVTKKTVETGNIVQPGQGLMALVGTDELWVTANFKETDLANVKPGQAAEIKVDMYGAKLPGHVDSIANATGARISLLPPENATGNYVKVVQRIPVKIVFDRGELERHHLSIGMNADATIVTR
jgi:membrane fusion protein (multidrug efflux system)